MKKERQLFEQAPTKRPATTAAGPKTKKAAKGPSVEKQMPSAPPLFSQKPSLFLAVQIVSDVRAMGDEEVDPAALAAARDADLLSKMSEES
eukprot:s2909_g10.t1